MKLKRTYPYAAPQAETAWQFFEAIAPQYEQDNLLLTIEEGLARQVLPSPQGRRVLDAGCGTGRWARWAAARKASEVVQLDQAVAMTEIAGRQALKFSNLWTVRGDLTRLPFADSQWDWIIASLCLGYTSRLSDAIGEFSRCLRPGGLLYISDLHPDSVQFGWRRTFPLTGGKSIEPPYLVHEIRDYGDCLSACGFRSTRCLSFNIDERLRSYFLESNHLQHYRAWNGTPLLLLILAQKSGAYGASDTSAGGS